jgi:hypothetical protein
MNIKRNQLLFVALSCIIGLSIYIYLNMSDEFPAGWKNPINLKITGGSPSLIIENDKFFLAFNKKGNEESIIAILTSEDGKEWITTDYIERNIEDVYTPSSPQWLQRPNGEIWLLWNSGRKFDDGVKGIKYYAVLKEDGTLSEPSILYFSDDVRCSLCKMANTASGGFASLHMYYPPSYIYLQGRKIEGEGDSDTLIRIADNNLHWNDSITLSDTAFSSCEDIILDDEGTLWVLYSESNPKDAVYLRTSEDGKTWSEPIFITKENTVRLFQRHNGQYLLFFITDDDSIYVKYSQDGNNWSRSHFIANVIGAMNLAIAESSVGTLWVIIDGNDFHVIEFSDKKYCEDMNLLQNLHQKNGSLAIGTALLFLILSFVFERKISR